MDGKALADAWNKWAESPEGKPCLDGATKGEYLSNRIWLAFMAGAREAEPLARKQEREECVKAMCIYCRRGILLEGSCHRNSNGDFLDVCRALAIHERNREEKG